MDSRRSILPAGLPLDQEFLVNHTRLVRVETVLEGVLELLDAEEIAAAAIGPIQKWTVMLTV